LTRKIFFITPALSGGGIELSTPILISNLKSLRNRSFQWIGINRSTFNGTIDETPVTSMDRSSGDGLVKTLQILWKLRNIILEEENPVVVVNGEVAELLTLLLPKRIQMVCVEHASRPWSMSRPLGYLVRRRLSARPTTWVTVNSKQITIWPHINKFSVIPNPVETIEINEDDQEVGLIHIGRVTRDKGVAMTCAAAAGGGFSLDVYGHGELLPDLLTEYIGNSRIRFHGYVENVWAKIGSKRLLVSASRHEGDGRNIAEAIVRRQPVLLLDTPDNRRFGLPEIHFYTDIDSLIGKVRVNEVNGFMDLRPSDQISKAEREGRNPSALALLWDSLLLTLEST